MRIRTFRCAALIALATMCSTAVAADRPNIVLIMADDLGYSDFGCYGGEIQTPNVDRLAANGSRFTQFYNTSRCCPTRASLLTGLYAHQCGIGHMTSENEKLSMDKGYPGYKGKLNRNCVTIAEVLKPAGYVLSYGRAWANASNTPFRRYKHWVHEGGIASPFVIHWPAKVKEREHGKLRRQPTHLIDLMATCLDVAGAEYPTTYQGHNITPLQGKSLLSAFDDQPIEREAIYWEHEGNRAVRRGKWKLVALHDRPWELYDMDADRTETNNLCRQATTDSR